MTIKKTVDVIAQRVFQARVGDKTIDVVLSIGKPSEENGEQSCWLCTYLIDGDGEQRQFYGAGLDSIQSLRIALRMSEIDLKNKFPDISWCNGKDLGLSGEV